MSPSEENTPEEQKLTAGSRGRAPKAKSLDSDSSNAEAIQWGSPDHIPVACFSTDDVGIIKSWNEAMTKLTGRAAQDVIGEKAWKTFYEKRQRMVHDEAIDDEKQSTGNIDIMDSEGGLRSYAVQGSPILQDGEVVGASVIFQDGKDSPEDCLIKALSNSNSNHSQANVMYADVDEKIIYVNDTAVKVLLAVEDDLAAYLPGFRVRDVMGGSIHRYHKDPERIKKMLQALGPDDILKGEITPGDFVFKHQTHAVFDDQGDKLGYVVEWTDATEQLKSENASARLTSALEGTSTAFMMCDRDLMITYVNPATMKLLEENISVFKVAYPGFDISHI
ncbi:MAG: PAS domain-containing protein, partial [Planctomycetes bacterium]|nr:PAS domain-containing protein [Planctomycetota bacterium]